MHTYTDFLYCMHNKMKYVKHKSAFLCYVTLCKKKPMSNRVVLLFCYFIICLLFACALVFISKSGMMHKKIHILLNFFHLYVIHYVA